MSSGYGKEIQEDLKVLIRQLLAGSPFENNTLVFKKVFKHWAITLKKHDTMYYANKNDIDTSIESMIEKFCFHGCFQESEILRKIYVNYIIVDDLPKNVCMNRLSAVKFLLRLSESPTQKLLETPFEFKLEEEEKEKENEKYINWAEFLNDGIEQWHPNFDESENSDLVLSSDEADLGEPSCSSSVAVVPTVIRSNEEFCTMNLKTSRDELMAIVQHTWYHSDRFQMVPESQRREANIGMLWEEHIRDQVKSLILLENPSIITEYNVIREILWQLWCPHPSTVFELCGNSIKPKSNITLASVRQSAFYTFMESFIPYIELLSYFRDFENSIENSLDENMCITYKCYCRSLNSIIQPIYKKLCDIENKVREQETLYTLQILAQDISTTLNPLKILYKIHQKVVLDITEKNPLQCATNLLASLHNSLYLCVNKLEQDLIVTLFLESCCHYFSLVNSWLMADNLTDFTKEFIIERKYDLVDHNPIFEVRDGIEDFCRTNTFLRIFEDRVLQIGKNISFLRILGKYDIIGDYSMTVYKEFINKIQKKLESFYNVKNVTQNNTIKQTVEEEGDLIFPIIYSESEVKSCNVDLEKLEHLVDTSDWFLMNAFADMFAKKQDQIPLKKVSLFNQISGTTKNLFPKSNFFENIFLEILNERFTVSGLMVKQMLVEQHLLEKQFEFLKHLYLFWDDLIFSFYRRLFEDVTSYRNNKSWAYELWLTSYLQDIFMDLYPEFYEKCSVTVKEQYLLCDDPLTAANFLVVNFEVASPLNAIIQKTHIEKYQEVFQFILILKWAIHTVNHLNFTDLQLKPKESLYKTSKDSQKSIKKLKQIKFFLINILNSLQHFIFTSVLSKNLKKFELNFEKAKGLSEIIESHSDFINTIYSSIRDIKICAMGSDKTSNVLTCVKLLKLMWNNASHVTTDALKECKKLYDDFYKEVSPIIFPVYIYDY